MDTKTANIDYTDQNAVMMAGTCVLCQHTLAEHFAKDGRWVGCNLKGNPNTALFLPPVMLVLAPQTLAQLPARETSNDAPRTRRARRSAEKVEAPAKPAKREKVEAKDDARGRGRIPGAYVHAGKEPTKLTESIEKVYHIIQRSKKGAQMKAIAEKLGMPSGTVGWALRKLVQQGAVEYHAAA